MRRLLFFIILVTFFCSCKEQAESVKSFEDRFPPKPNPENYIAYRTSVPIIPDGKLDEPVWGKAPWTNYFRDIEGSKKPDPWYKTRAKILWDEKNIYFGAYLDDPHVWAKLRQRDTIVFIDNDFEVFIDPDGDTHAYYELEVNALGTPWDLLLIKPYRDGGPAVFSWDISGLKVGTNVDGTINNPADEDKGWSVEIVIPLSVLRECTRGGQLPKAGDQWRLGFSRVEWKTHIENGSYVKDINPATGRPFPEENWVWSPQGRINMHMPEMWGYLQFSEKEAGKGTEEFIPDPDFDLKWALRMIYYAEQEYYQQNKKYTSDIKELDLTAPELTAAFSNPVIQTTKSGFECWYEGKPLTIYEDGLIIRKAEK